MTRALKIVIDEPAPTLKAQAQAALEVAQSVLDAAQRDFDAIEAKQRGDVAAALAAFDAEPTEERADDLARIQLRAERMISHARKKLDAPRDGVHAAQKLVAFEHRAELVTRSDLACARARREERAKRATNHLRGLLELHAEAVADAHAMSLAYDELARIDALTADRTAMEMESRSLIAVTWIDAAKPMIGLADYMTLRDLITRA